LTKIVFTVFHNRASDVMRGSKQWWILAGRISRGSGPSNPRRIDAYVIPIAKSRSLQDLPVTTGAFFIIQRL